MIRSVARSALLTSSLVVVLGCDDKPKPSADPAVTASASAATSPLASSITPPAPSAAASVVSAEPAPSASVAAKKDPKDPKAAGSAATPTLKPASKHVTGKNFALDLASPGCKATEECSMTIKLAPGAEFHVNKEYPYKFIATPAAGVTFLGKSDPNTFARSSGDFAEQGEKSATMTVRFKAASAGEAKVAGKYKLSVCSADQCQIEEPTLDLTVPVM